MASEIGGIHHLTIGRKAPLNAAQDPAIGNARFPQNFTGLEVHLIQHTRFLTRDQHRFAVRRNHADDRATEVVVGPTVRRFCEELAKATATPN